MSTRVTTPAAIKATFSDFKIVKTRKLAQLIFEIPIESADAALTAIGGLPHSDKEVWCAIARLDVNAVKESKPPEKKREFCDLPFVTQAALKSTDEKFLSWLYDYYPGLAAAPNGAAAIRHFCNVSTRSAIVKGTPAGNNWLSLLRQYEEYAR